MWLAYLEPREPTFENPSEDSVLWFSGYLALGSLSPRWLSVSEMNQHPWGNVRKGAGAPNLTMLPAKPLDDDGKEKLLDWYQVFGNRSYNLHFIRL